MEITPVSSTGMKTRFVKCLLLTLPMDFAGANAVSVHKIRRSASASSLISNFLGVDTESAIRRGALEIHTFDEVYFPNRRFEPEAMMDLLLHSIEDAWNKGFSALRTAGELSWASEGGTDCD